MLSFKQFFINLSEAKLSGSGSESERHARQYIEPFIGQIGTHKIAKKHGHIEADSTITVHGHGVDEKGKRFATVSSLDEPDKKINVPFSKIHKPTKKSNKGFDFETGVVKKLNEHGLMSGEGAGFSGANDFHLINKKKNAVHEGTLAENIHQGETKKDLSAAFGQASLNYHPEKGWHFSDKTRARFPEYVRHIENATVTVDGKRKKLLDHINDSYGAPDPEKKSSTNLYSDETDLSPMHGYLSDHHVDVLHVGSHGTFRAGLSGKTDRTGTDLPTPKGKGRFRVRQKHKNSLTVQFNVKHMDKSLVNLESDEGINYMKERLGHKESSASKNDIQSTPGSNPYL